MEKEFGPAGETEFERETKIEAEFERETEIETNLRETNLEATCIQSLLLLASN